VITQPTPDVRGPSPTGSHSGRRNRPQTWSPASVDPMLVIISILELFFFVYFVVSTELLLTHNPEADQSANQWGFGQILALILIVPSGISVVSAFLEHGIKRLHHRGSRGPKRYGRAASRDASPSLLANSRDASPSVASNNG